MTFDSEKFGPWSELLEHSTHIARRIERDAGSAYAGAVVPVFLVRLGGWLREIASPAGQEILHRIEVVNVLAGRESFAAGQELFLSAHERALSVVQDLYFAAAGAAAGPMVHSQVLLEGRKYIRDDFQDMKAVSIELKSRGKVDWEDLLVGLRRERILIVHELQAVGSAAKNEPEIPPLDRDNGEWIKAVSDAMQETYGRSERSLRVTRSRGYKADDGDSGSDTAGQVWRRDPDDYKLIWYLKKTVTVNSRKDR